MGVVLDKQLCEYFVWSATYNHVFEQINFIWASEMFCNCFCSMALVNTAGEMLYVAEQFLDRQFHPTVICRG